FIHRHSITGTEFSGDVASPPSVSIGRLRIIMRCRHRSERAKRSARLFRVIYEVVSFGTAMGQARLTTASLKTVIAARPSRAEAAAFIPTNPEPSGRCSAVSTTALRVSSGARVLRLRAGRKDNNVQQNAYRCLPPGGDPGYRHSRQQD